MTRKATISLSDLRNSACARLNPHLFGDHKKEKGNAKKSKYGNNKVEVDGITFDSEKEAKRYGQLKMMQKAGMIAFLKLQEKYDLVVNENKVCSYIADFVYTDAKTGQEVVEDVKSEMTRKLPLYRMKKKLMKQVFNIEIKEV